MSVGAANFCNYKISGKESGVQETRFVDLTGGETEKVVIFEGEVQWGGNKESCRKIFERFLTPRSMEAFNRSTEKFAAPIFELKSIGANKWFCRNKSMRKQVENLGVRWTSGEKCGISLYGNQKALFSYAPYKRGKISADDLLRLNLLRYDVSGKTVALGTIARFSLANGMQMKGIVVNASFPRWGRVNGRSLELAKEDINLYIMSKVGIQKVRLGDIKAVDALSEKQSDVLKKVFENRNQSMETMIKNLDEKWKSEEGDNDQTVDL